MELQKIAVVLIGYQNDYFAEDGTLHGVIEEPGRAASVLSNTLALIERLRSTPVHLIATPIIFTPDYTELVDPVGILKTIQDVGAFKVGLKGAEIIPEFLAFGNRIVEVAGRRGLDAFSNTHLNDVLQEKGVTDVVLAGVVTSICIDSTGRSAAENGYKVYILSDCTAGRTDVEQSFYCERIFPLYAEVVESSTLFARIQESSRPDAADDNPMNRRELDLQARYSLVEDLSRSKRQYRTLVEHLYEIVFQTDDQFKFTFLNRAWTTLTNVAVADAIGRSITDFIAPPGQKVWKEFTHKFKNKTGECHVRDLSLNSADGDHRWVSFFIKKDESGSGWTGSMYDITDNKRSEGALRESEERFRAIFETAQDAIFIKDQDLRYTQTNPAMEKLFGLPSSKLIGLMDEDLFGEQIGGAIREVDLRILGGSIIEEEYILPVKEVSLHFHIIKVPMRDNSGRISGLCGIARNITELKKKEEELHKMQKLKSIGTLAGGIAHDFNNTLTVIFGNVSIAKSMLSNVHPSFEALETAEMSLRRATHLTGQLLTFAKGGEPVVEDVSLGQLVKEVVEFDLSGSSVMPVLDQDEELWAAKVDHGQIQQVISNLATNARQAMPNGGCLYIALKNADIEEKAIPGLSQGRYIKVTVRDEGTGIKQEDLVRIFDPYFTTKSTGSGLGLATVFSIINRHGGHISVDSEIDKGTAMTLYLPASDLEQQPEAEPPETKVSVKVKSARVLVMDDDIAIQKVVNKTLVFEGHTVETAFDGQEAIALYRQSLESGAPFDVVILDLTIPGGIGGKEAIKDILELDPHARVIVSSGYANDPVMANYEEYGFKAIVAKPYSLKDLRDTVNRILRKGDDSAV